MRMEGVSPTRPGDPGPSGSLTHTERVRGGPQRRVPGRDSHVRFAGRAQDLRAQGPNCRHPLGCRQGQCRPAHPLASPGPPPLRPLPLCARPLKTRTLLSRSKR